MKHYPHHIGDFNGATRHLTRIERSVYRDLLDLYYDTEQPLNTDVALLCRRILANSNEESTAVKQVLKEFFTSAKLGWYHDRCEAVIYSYHQNTSQKALAGKASAEAKRLRKQQAMAGTNGQQPLKSVATKPQRNSTNHKPKPEPKPLTKDKSATIVAFVLPEWIDKNLWDGWHSTPKRKNATDEQKTLAVKKITKWRDEGLDWQDALEKSAIGGYQGLFAPSASNGDKGQALTFAERDQLAKQKRWEEMTGKKWPTESQSFIDVDTSVLELK